MLYMLITFHLVDEEKFKNNKISTNWIQKEHTSKRKKKKNVSQHKKAIYDSYITSYTVRRFESFSLKISNKTMVFLFTTPIHHNTGSPGQNNQERKRNKRHQNQRRIKNVSACRWYDIIYRKPKKTVKELINKFSKIAR